MQKGRDWRSMQNPGIRTLSKFLSIIESQEPTTRQGISNSLNRAYGMVNDYLKFSLDKGLIEVSKVVCNRGPWPQKFYALTTTGRELIRILEGMQIEQGC